MIRRRRSHWIVTHQKRVSRKYNIKDDNFVRYVVSCLKSVAHEDVAWRLDEYERAAIKDKAKWVRNADLDEIIVIMTKLGFPMFLTGLDASVPQKPFPIKAWKRKFVKERDVNGLLSEMAQHKFFVLGGRDAMKAQGLFSQLVNGSLYVPNNDFKNFLKHGMNAEGYSDLKNVDIAFGAMALQNGYGDLDVTDLAILYLCKRYDDMPLAGKAVYEIMEYKRDRDVIQRHIGKLVKYGYLYRHGVKQDAMYSLTEKGMLILNKARKAFFENCQFWNQEKPNETFKQNGTGFKIANQASH